MIVRVYVCIDLIVCGVELEGEGNNGGFEGNAGKNLTARIGDE